MTWKKRSQECIHHLVDRTEQVLAQHVFIAIFMGEIMTK